VVNQATSAVASSLPALPQPAAVAHAVQKTSLATKLFGGAVAGVVGTSIIYPMDMVKTRLQNQTRTVSAQGVATMQYKGGVDCFRQILQKEGFRGFYKGLPANLVGIIPEKAIKLAVNDYAREYLANREYQRQVSELRGSKAANAAETLAKLEAKGPDADKLSIPQGMLAGAIAGFSQVIATNPMETAKINAQMAAVQGGANKTSWTIVKELGLRGLYRGTPATLMRDVPFSFIFFPTSSYLRQLAAERDRRRGGEGKVPFSVVFWSGIGAGILAAGAVTPADVIKTRLQTRRTDGIVYRGIAHAAQEIYQKEGLKAFMKGAPQRCMIIAPLFGITLVVYELQQRYYSGKK
jgi:solute carrier family 25 aspartate/glutamate transporter 12/13